MKSQIRNIRNVVCGGAFGDANKMGQFTYGMRPDGKTVRCKSHWDNVTGMTISSRGSVTEYSREEWMGLLNAPSGEQMKRANAILDARAPKP